MSWAYVKNFYQSDMTCIEHEIYFLFTSSNLKEIQNYLTDLKGDTHVSYSKIAL